MFIENQYNMQCGKGRKERRSEWLQGAARNASMRGRDARASRSHEVSNCPRLTRFAKYAQKNAKIKAKNG